MRSSKSKKGAMSRSEIMARIKAKDTRVELLLRRELWKRGLRYRKNVKDIYGKPDIAFLSRKLAVFCDSEFWHGKKYLEGEIPATNKAFWREKFRKNIERDIQVNWVLRQSGWTVIRFWEKDIKKDVAKYAKKIEEALKRKKKGKK